MHGCGAYKTRGDAKVRIGLTIIITVCVLRVCRRKYAKVPNSEGTERATEDQQEPVLPGE